MSGEGAQGASSVMADTCRTCNHPRTEHAGTEGPYAGGEYTHAACRSGWVVVGPYLVPADGWCTCQAFRRQPWWRRLAADLTEEKRDD